MRAKVIKRSCPVDLEPRHQRIVAGEHLNRWRFSPVKHHDVIVPRFAVRDDDAAIRGFDGFQAGREYVKTCKVNIALSASILEGFHLGSYLWFDERDFVVAPSPSLGLKGSFHVRRNRQGKITARATPYAQETFSANVRQFNLHKLPNFRVGIGVDRFSRKFRKDFTPTEYFTGRPPLFNVRPSQCNLRRQTAPVCKPIGGQARSVPSIYREAIAIKNGWAIRVMQSVFSIAFHV